MSEEETVTLSFDPRRTQVHGVVAEAMQGQSEDLIEQAIADALMGACVLGEVCNISDEEQYFAMIRAALPNAKKAAAHHRNSEQ